MIMKLIHFMLVKVQLIELLGNIVREWSSATEASEKGNFHTGPTKEEKEKYINLIDITTKI